MQQDREQLKPPPEENAVPYRGGVQAAVLAGLLAASFLVAALGGLATINNV
jgi:benzodiazapine receptor